MNDSTVALAAIPIVIPLSMYAAEYTGDGAAQKGCLKKSRAVGSSCWTRSKESTKMRRMLRT